MNTKLTTLESDKLVLTFPFKQHHSRNYSNDLRTLNIESWINAKKIFSDSVSASCQDGQSPRLKRRELELESRPEDAPDGEEEAPPASVLCPRSSSLRMTTVRRIQVLWSILELRWWWARMTPACPRWNTPCLRILDLESPSNVRRLSTATTMRMLTTTPPKMMVERARSPRTPEVRCTLVRWRNGVTSTRSVWGL